MVTVEDQLRCQQEIQKELIEMKLILVGPRGENGVRSEVKKIRNEIEGLNKWKTQAATIFFLIQAIGVPVVVALILKLIK